jgi:hypothetical protein
MERLKGLLERNGGFNVDGLSCGRHVLLFLLLFIFVSGTREGRGQTTILEVNATSFQNVYTPVAGPTATFLTNDYLVFDSTSGLTCIGGTWRAGVRYSPVAFNGSELVAEVDYTPYGQTDGNLMTLIDPNGTEIRLEVIRRGRLGLRYGSQKTHTVVINWSSGCRTVRLIRTSNTMRLEFNGATWLTMANLPSLTTGNYQVKVGCLAANDPSAQGYFYHWRVISRTTPSTVLPAPNWGLSSTITSQLQALENRADALCVPEITGTPTQLTIQQLRSAAARVTLDSLWNRAYKGKTSAFDAMVTDLNTNIFDPLENGTDNVTVIPLAQITSTGDRWLIDDDGLYFGLVGWDVAPYIKDIAQLGHNLISTSIVPGQVFDNYGVPTMKNIEGEILPILDLAARYGMKVDIMLSFYTPDFLEWTYGWKNPNSTCGNGFLQACILNNDFRSMCQTYINQVVTRIKDHPALGSYCLGNEIKFREYCDEAQSRFRVYLQGKYSTITSLNVAWGSAYSSWSNITMTQTMGTDKTNQSRYWDWVDFNGQLGAEYIDFLKDTIKAIDSVTPVHVKTLPHEFGFPDSPGDDALVNYANGVDLRTIHNNNDLIGTDSYSDYVNGFYNLACNPLWQLMCYDLLNSYDPSKPLFDSEWHIVNISEWTSGTYLNAMMYLGTLHNLRAGTMWVCNPEVDTVDVVSEASTLYHSGLSASKLRSLTPSIRALAQRPKPIALLYSRVSKNVDGHGHFRRLRKLFEAGLYTGLGVTLLEERDLIEGNLNGAQAILAFDCPHTLPGVGQALANFAQNGGIVRCFGSVAAKNPDGTSQNSTLSICNTGAGYGIAQWQWPDDNLNRWPGVTKTFTTSQDWSEYDVLMFDMAQQGTETGVCYFRYQIWCLGFRI